MVVSVLWASPCNQVSWSAVAYKELTNKLFYSQKPPKEGWNSNTLRQFFHHLFKKVGIEGASSHSPRRTLITNLADKG